MHARDKPTGREREVALRVDGRLIAQAQLDRVELQFFGQLVHRLFQRQHAHRLAGGARRIGHRQVQLDRAVRGEPVRGGVQGARLHAGRLKIVVEAGAVRPGLVADGAELSVGAGCQSHTLHRVAAVRREVKHLLPRQRSFHRAVELAGRHRAQRHITIDRQLAAEAATDVATDDAHLVGRDLQRVGDRVLRAFEQLRCAVNVHPSVFPVREGGVRLHRRMNVAGRREGRVDLDGTRGKGRLEVAHRAVGFLAGLIGGAGGRGQVGCQVVVAGLRLVFDLDQARSRPRLLEGLRHHEGHGLSVMLDPVAAQLRRCARVPIGSVERAPGALLRSVLVRQHQQHAGCLLGGGRVDLGHRALGNRGLDDEATGRRAAFLHFMRIGRLAHHLEPALDPVDRLADQALTVFVDRIARGRYRHFHRGFSFRLRSAPRAMCVAAVES